MGRNLNFISGVLEPLLTVYLPRMLQLSQQVSIKKGWKAATLEKATADNERRHVYSTRLEQSMLDYIKKSITPA